MEIKNLRKINKGKLICSFEVYLTKLGLHIYDCLLFDGTKGLWVKMPGRQYEDKDGQQKSFSHVRWDKEKQESFEKQVIELVSKEIETSELTDPGVDLVETDFGF